MVRGWSSHINSFRVTEVTEVFQKNLFPVHLIITHLTLGNLGNLFSLKFRHMERLFFSAIECLYSFNVP